MRVRHFGALCEPDLRVCRCSLGHGSGLTAGAPSAVAGFTFLHPGCYMQSLLTPRFSTTFEIWWARSRARPSRPTVDAWWGASCSFGRSHPGQWHFLARTLPSLPSVRWFRVSIRRLLQASGRLCGMRFVIFMLPSSMATSSSTMRLWSLASHEGLKARGRVLSPSSGDMSPNCGALDTGVIGFHRMGKRLRGRPLSASALHASAVSMLPLMLDAALLDPLVGSFRQAVSDEQEAYVWSRAALEA